MITQVSRKHWNHVSTVHPAGRLRKFHETTPEVNHVIWLSQSH